MPNLNPFSGAAQPPTSTRRTQPASSTWKMPQLWQQTKAQPKTRRNPPSTLSQVTKGTQNVLSKTADALNPWDKKQPAPPPKLSGSNSIFTDKSTIIPAKKDTGVKPASWWGGDKSQSKDKTVNEFLSHPRLD